MNILGINCAGHDSSVALICDGHLVFAAGEERFTRVKHDRNFPAQSIRAALKFAGIDFSDLDGIAFGFEHAPAFAVQDYKALVTGKVALTLSNILSPLAVTALQVALGNGRRPLKTEFGSLAGIRIIDVNHHQSHAWSAYGLSGFDEALVLVVDGRGGESLRPSIMQAATV